MKQLTYLRSDRLSVLARNKSVNSNLNGSILNDVVEVQLTTANPVEHRNKMPKTKQFSLSTAQLNALAKLDKLASEKLNGRFAGRSDITDKEFSMLICVSDYIDLVKSHLHHKNYDEAEKYLQKLREITWYFDFKLK